MPTTITPAVETVINTGSQNLFTTGTTSTIPAVQPTSVEITSTAGTFSSDFFRSYNSGDTVTISGTIGGNVTISGYVDPTTYFITDTDQSTTFTLSTTPGGANIVTTSGPTTGLSFAASGTVFPAQAGAVFYATVPSPQTVVWSAVSANIGNAITANTTTGVFNLSANVANVAYQLTGFVNVTSVPATYGWINTAGNTAIGPRVATGTPLSTVFVKTANTAANVALQVTTVSGEAFAYPAQIQGASATVSELSGYVVA